LKAEHEDDRLLSYSEEYNSLAKVEKKAQTQYKEHLEKSKEKQESDIENRKNLLQKKKEID